MFTPQRSLVRVQCRPLVVSPAKTRLSVTCRRSAVWRFPEAQNGTYRFGTYGDPHHATSRSRSSEVSSASQLRSGRRHPQRPRPLSRPYGTKASRIEYDRLIGEWLAAGRHPLHVTRRRFDRSWNCASAIGSLPSPTTKPATPRSVPARHQAGDALPAGPLRPHTGRGVWSAGSKSHSPANGRGRLEPSRTSTVTWGRIKRIFKWAVGEQLLPPEVYPIVGDRSWPPTRPYDGP